jgi:predicted PurR-regulated permease PerM
LDAQSRRQHPPPAGHYRKWILWPFFGAVLWAAVLAIVFAPLHRRLWGLISQQQNLAALSTVLIILALVIVPLTLIAASLVREATSLHEEIKSGNLDFGTSFEQVMDASPTSLCFGVWSTDRSED